MTPRPYCSGLAPGTLMCRADVCLAVDRPDRLEVEFVPGATGFPSLEPGAAVQFAVGDHVLFSGLVERGGLQLGRSGLRGRLVAYASFEARRGSKPSDRYYQLTDAEIAGRIASELGLQARVEPTREIHHVLERPGDPLRFLRARARQLGFELAVTAGTLYFASELPVLGDAYLFEGVHGVSSLDVESRGRLGCGGSLELRGDPGLLPLRTLQLSFGTSWDGAYRAVRCAHFFDRLGYRTRVEFLERGADMRRWEEIADGIADRE